MKIEPYPFLEKIRGLLPKKEKIVWLAAQIDKSERWFYGLDIEKVDLVTLNKISTTLNFNFMEDYNHWLTENKRDPLFIASEPTVEYKRAEKKINIDFRVSGTLSSAESNSSKLLLEMRVAAEKYGFQLDLL